jgi:hypothetical protein
MKGTGPSRRNRQTAFDVGWNDEELKVELTDSSRSFRLLGFAFVALSSGSIALMLCVISATEDDRGGENIKCEWKTQFAR